MASTPAAPSTELDLERYRPELTGYCYRMLGSSFEAEDAVQEAMLRAWRASDRFEGRSSVKSWLYQIATNVCLDMLDGRKRRERPLDMGPASTIEGPLTTHPEETWIEPVPGAAVIPEDADPAEQVAARETLRLAFVAALQHLPPRQRAVLILREVLRWQATEVAELLGTSVPSVNSALQRARATIEADEISPAAAPEELAGEEQELVDRYLHAFEDYDIESLVKLLHEDATLSMPPYELWLRGPVDIRGWWTGPGSGCRGSRLVPLSVNGAPGFGQYRPSGPGGSFEPWAIQLLETSGGRITGLVSFLDTARYFPLFGLPATVES